MLKLQCLVAFWFATALGAVLDEFWRERFVIMNDEFTSFLRNNCSRELQVEPFEPLFELQGPPVTRKEYRCLRPHERHKFHDALQKTRQTRMGNLSQYEYFQRVHYGLIPIRYHASPLFAPWHRQFNHQFEQVLRSHCSDCGLPFWDSRLESRLRGNPQHSSFFSPQLAGTAVGIVTSGVAANWTTLEECHFINPLLSRDVVNHSRYYFEDTEVEYMEQCTSHECFSHMWNDILEGTHNFVHLSFGFASHMIDFNCTAADPIFYLLHNFVDNLFERARQNIKRHNPPLRWANISQLANNPNDPLLYFFSPDTLMIPFNIPNSVGLFKDYDEFYNYEQSPADVVGCRKDSDCCDNGYSRFVWCHAASGRCLSKVMEGGTINTTFPSNACYCEDALKTAFIELDRCACALPAKEVF